MKTKYVCRGLIGLYVNFHLNRTIWSINLHVKNCRWGEKEKEPNFQATIGQMMGSFLQILTSNFVDHIDRI